MDVEMVSVFTHEGGGGNPCPTVLRADRVADAEMQALARQYGRESGFVLSSAGDGCDFRFRFWAPNHEMEMCGHATVGALWLLARAGALRSERVVVETLSGVVTGFVETGREGGWSVSITQPAGRVREIGPDARVEILAVLGIGPEDLLDLPVQNAATSRAKTLVPIRDVARLNALQPDFSRMEAVCARIGSTGLYPYAPHEGATQTFEARQFPRAAGYPEDAATGIAATALAFGLVETGVVERSDRLIRVLQGRVTGRLSEIHVRLGVAGGRAIACTVGGAVSEGM